MLSRQSPSNVNDKRMDCSAFNVSAAILAVFVIFVAYKLKKRREHFSQFKKLGIPGPEPSFIYGNIMTIFWKTHLVAQKEWHEKYGPIVGYYFGYQPIVLIADGDLLKTILLKDFQNFADRGSPFGRTEGDDVSGNLTELKGQRWKKVRSTLTPSFTSSKLKQLSPEVCHIVDEFIGNVEKHSSKGEEFDMYEYYQALTLDTICRSAMGVDFEIQKDVKNSEVLKHMKLTLSNNSLITSLFVVFPSIRRAAGKLITSIRLRLGNSGKDPVKVMREKCAAVVKQRRSNPELRRVDLLQLLIDAKEVEGNADLNSLIAGEDAEKHEALQNSKTAACPAGKSKGLTELEIISNAFVVLIAGYETTSSSLAFITRVLLRFPEVQERLREELLEATEQGTVFDFERLQKCHYLEAVIQEVLRMYPPIHNFTSRHVNQETTYGSLTIPRGAGIFVSTRQLHYDEEIFPDPYEFRPTRFLPENKTPAMSFAWLPFGAGPRNCIGMRFAQMEMKIALAKLLTKYRLSSKHEPAHDIHIEVVGRAILQQIKDPLLCIAEKI